MDLFLFAILLFLETEFEMSLLIMLTVSGDLDLFFMDTIELFFLHSLLENYVSLDFSA